MNAEERRFQNVILEGLHARLVDQGQRREAQGLVDHGHRREAQELRALLDAAQVFDPENDGQTRFLFFPHRGEPASAGPDGIGAGGKAAERQENEFAAVTILRGGQSVTLPRAHLRAFVSEHLLCVVPLEAASCDGGACS